MKILFIGSDREIVFMTAKILRRHKYEVFCAIGKGEAIQMLQSEKFDLALIDCDIGLSECISLIDEVKSAIGPPGLLVISGSGEEEVALLQAGADDWIKKPYQMNILLARMAALLRRNK